MRGVVCAVAMLLMVAACGGGSDSSADAERSTPEAGPESTVPPQPSGEHGAILKLQNWDEYYDDPAVVAATSYYQAGLVSTNEGQITDVVQDRSTKKVLRKITKNMRSAWKNDFHTQEKVHGRVETVKSEGDQTTVKFCVNHYEISLRDKDNKILTDAKKGDWVNVTITLTGADDDDFKVSRVPKTGKQCDKEPAGDSQ